MCKFNTNITIVDAKYQLELSPFEWAWYLDGRPLRSPRDHKSNFLKIDFLFCFVWTLKAIFLLSLK